MLEDALLTLLFLSASGGIAAAQWQPTKPVEIVVSAGAGGGTDQLARLIQSVIVKHKLMDQATVVINKGGGSGAEGYLYMKLASGDSHKVIVGTNNEYLLPLVANVGYKWDDLTPVAALAQDDFLLWTPTDAPFKTANEYLDAAKADPSKFKMGGSQSKDVDQTLTKLIDRAYGTKFTYIPFKSGGEAATQLVGKHISSNVNNPNENIAQWRAGQVKPLCVFSRNRMTYTQKVTATMAWSDVPTCKEQGVPIDEYRMPRAVYMPTGATPDQVRFYVELLRKVVETPEWKEYLDRNALAPAFLTGDAFVKFIREDEQRARKVFADEGWLVK
jgi:putative tricarboxylic transport membrane protein